MKKLSTIPNIKGGISDLKKCFLVKTIINKYVIDSPHSGNRYTISPRPCP